ncbi:MAG: Holliday junction resolvase RuvX [Elusimicrobiota bacterium]|jgi:putative Holliday junction resolvase|nr:Holliday junction resolvase RuvX [Elusimicrobiota bacterium]
MGRILAIDYGLKRIGLATTDLLQIMANPFDVIESASIDKNVRKILEISQKNEVSEIVIGLPLNMDGSEGEMAKLVRKFIDKFRAASNIKIEPVDERLSSWQTDKILIEKANMSREKRKKVRDKIAAAIILQTYLIRKSEQKPQTK